MKYCAINKQNISVCRIFVEKIHISNSIYSSNIQQTDIIYKQISKNIFCHVKKLNLEAIQQLSSLCGSYLLLSLINTLEGY